MANQGLLAQLKPNANTDTVLYSAPINQSASTVLTIANDGTGSAYDVALKDYSQKLTLDASTYKLHEGDVISNYQVTLGSPINENVGVNPGQLLTTSDSEKTFRFESFVTPAVTTIFVKAVDIRAVTLEGVSGSFEVGDTFSKGAAPDTTTATVYAVEGGTIYIGPSTFVAPATEFAAGDSISVTSGGAGTIAASPAITTAEGEFVFSTTTAGGVYDMYVETAEQLPVFDDRTYRFDVSDTSMSGRDFKLSETVNGEFGPDGDFTLTDDNGTEYTTGKTTNGTAGSAGAYVQYAFGDSVTPPSLYYYDGGTGTATNSSYGGVNRGLDINDTGYEYDAIFVYDLVGTLVNNTDTVLIGGTTYTITGQTSGAYGYVRDYTGTTLKFIKGPGSPDFSATDTFKDVPKDNEATRSTATVSSVDVAAAAVEASNYLSEGVTNAANNVDRITSLVVGPGETVVVNSATANNSFSLVGFEDSSDSITVRVFGQV